MAERGCTTATYLFWAGVLNRDRVFGVSRKNFTPHRSLRQNPKFEIRMPRHFIPISHISKTSIDKVSVEMYSIYIEIGGGGLW